MRRVTLDDLLRVASALEDRSEPDWSAHVVDLCGKAHLADAVRKRLGTRAAFAFGSPHLGGRVTGGGNFASDRLSHRKLAAVLNGLERWRARSP